MELRMRTMSILIIMCCFADYTLATEKEASESACQTAVTTLFTASQAEDGPAMDRVLATGNLVQAALATAYRQGVLADARLAHVAAARFPDATDKLPPSLAEMINGRMVFLARRAAKGRVLLHGDTADLTIMDETDQVLVVVFVLDKSEAGWQIRPEHLFGMSLSAPVEQKKQVGADRLRMAQAATQETDAIRAGKYVSMRQAMDEFQRTYMEIVMSQIPTTRPSTLESTVDQSRH